MEHVDVSCDWIEVLQIIVGVTGSATGIAVAIALGCLLIRWIEDF